MENDDRDEMATRRRMFRDPGGRSALRAARRGNPRNLPCPKCGAPNKLTPADVREHHVCDSCADLEEGAY